MGYISINDMDKVRNTLKSMESKIKSMNLNERESRIFDTVHKAVHSREFSHLVEETNSKTIQDYIILKTHFFKAKGL